ncbi:hypothetical protein J1614_005089 [Plenodomus biglobosus]|nr:hypothetical protein J1614_005089 [Plenodomus biglobosus]
MAMGDGRTEVPDSEDEPMTSSPIYDSASDANKLSATGPVPPQDQQDTLLAANGSHQAPAKDLANAASASAQTLVVDPCNVSANVDEFADDLFGTHNIVPQRQQSHAHEAENSAMHAETAFKLSPPDLTVGDMALRPQGTEEDPAEHDPSLDSTASSAVVTCSSLNNKTNSNDYRTSAGQAESVEHDLEDVVHAIAPSLSVEKAGEARGAANVTNGGHNTQPVPVDTCQNIDLGSIQVTPTDNSLHEASCEFDSTKNHIHDELAVEALLPSTSVEGHASCRAADNIDQDCNQVRAEYISRMSDATPTASGTSHLRKPDRVESTSTGDVESWPRENASNDAGQPHSMTEAPKTSTEAHSIEPGYKTCEPLLDQDVHVTVPKPPIPEATIISPFKQSSDGQRTQRQDSENDRSVNHRNIETHSKETESQVASSPAPSVSISQPLHTSAEFAGRSTTDPPIPKTPQEITLAELKAQKTALLASLATMPAIQVLIEECATPETDADDALDGPTEADVMTAANKIVKEHIKLLHEYNELKDVGQGLMGLIADQRGVRIVEVQEEFGIEAKD